MTNFGNLRALPSTILTLLVMLVMATPAVAEELDIKVHRLEAKLGVAKSVVALEKRHFAIDSQTARDTRGKIRAAVKDQLATQIKLKKLIDDRKLEGLTCNVLLCDQYIGEIDAKAIVIADLNKTWNAQRVVMQHDNYRVLQAQHLVDKYAAQVAKAIEEKESHERKTSG